MHLMLDVWKAQNLLDSAAVEMQETLPEFPPSNFECKFKIEICLASQWMVRVRQANGLLLGPCNTLRCEDCPRRPASLRHPPCPLQTRPSPRLLPGVQLLHGTAE